MLELARGTHREWLKKVGLVPYEPGPKVIVSSILVSFLGRGWRRERALTELGLAFMDD